MLNSDYPYHDYSGTCKYKKGESKTYGNVKSWYQISTNEEEIKKTTAE